MDRSPSPSTPTVASDAVLDAFHPAVAGWFRRVFEHPTAAQVAAWPSIRAGRHTLVAAPTGSGKTLTAFLAAIDGLVRQGLAAGGELPDQTTVVYVSPLKALSNDIRLNLEAPLAGIRDELRALGLPEIAIRAAVRTGDTPSRERVAMRKRPPHILVTTPESLYVLLGSDSGRRMLATTRAVIVDEIHAVAGTKRGSHLALSLERLQALSGQPLARVGLSATQHPIEAVARFLVGRSGDGDCEIVDIGHARRRELAIEVPPVPLAAVMANDVWERVYDRLAELARGERTTLVFVNTRRMAERAARHLSERLGRDAVAAHHGSLAREQRLDAEQRLKRGELRLLVATASLELGIDIGEVDLVCQLGSPRSIAAFLQRIGRSGHQIAGVPRGRLFPTSRDDLIECVALLDCVRRGELDTLVIPQAPLDVLAQQIVAEVACQEWHEDRLFELIRRAGPYAELSAERYQALLGMLAQGFSGRFGPRAAYLHRDAVSRTLRARRASQLVAVTSGGTIPESGDYSVMLEPTGHPIGTVNEDFAVESLPGDIFQLGNTSYRIIKIEPGRVRVEDARGQPPNIPFWIGEAPGRSDALSAGVARLREEIDQRLGDQPTDGTSRLAPAIAWLEGELGLDQAAAQQIVDYLAVAKAALGALPTQRTLVMERFFDESGGMQLVIHSPFGSRINRAWGLALRKRFCRSFDVELQAAATEDAIVLSLSTSHSFALDEVWHYLRAASAERVLIQALLDAPLFGVRWRWNATVALALPRMAGGRKVAPQLQRMRSDDLLATVFPDQAACIENIVGEREIPDHPLVRQTLDDCLHEAMDSPGWIQLLERIESGDVRLIARDLPAPSPLAAEVLGAQPYAFLDDAPLEERRTQAVLARRWSDPESADDLGALDPAAIAEVREEAWPRVRDADEMSEALNSLAGINLSEVPDEWRPWLDALAASGRAARVNVAEGEWLWVAVERLNEVRAVYATSAGLPRVEPSLEPPPGFDQEHDDEQALVALVRARLGASGPVTLAELARPLALSTPRAAQALAALEAQGYALRGRFDPHTADEQWCERQLLARIHRLTLRRLRREIAPVEPADFVRFLFDWQRLSADTRGRGTQALATIVEQLEGYQAAASSWESDILPARLVDYHADQLDELCRSGRVIWKRQAARQSARPGSGGGPVRATPIVLLPRSRLATWDALAASVPEAAPSPRAERVAEVLRQQGALFFDELLAETRLLRSELENALAELVGAGLVNADGFAGLRALISPAPRRTRAQRHGRHTRGSPLAHAMEQAGRWALLRRAPSEAASPAAHPAYPADALEHLVRVLLRRYGVIFWRLLEREADWLPPWRELLRVLHRLEARGEIRGGRFVNGTSGEQFALPEAVGPLRRARHRGSEGTLQLVCATDPLNLVGILLPGERVPALAGNRIVYRDGVPIARALGARLEYLVPLDAQEQAEVCQLLARHGKG